MSFSSAGMSMSTLSSPLVFTTPKSSETVVDPFVAPVESRDLVSYGAKQDIFQEGKKRARDVMGVTERIYINDIDVARCQ